MSHTIPLIRSAVVFPLLRWLRENDRSVPDQLHAAGLAYVSAAAPERPIPLLSAMTLLRNMGRSEGPDIAARAFHAGSFADLGTFGQVFTGSPTPRVALNRAACVLPRYSSHELVAVRPLAGGGRLEAGWSVVIDDETVAITQQFTAALILKLLSAAWGGQKRTLPVRIMPHPQLGLGHLCKWFGDDVAASPGPVLTIDIDDASLDAPLTLGPPLRDEDAAAFVTGWDVLIGDHTLAHSVRQLLAAMADGPPATLSMLAQAAGMSERSFQRCLLAEGTSFRTLVDDVRRERTLAAVLQTDGPLSHVSQGIGYAAQSSLSRAVRRWTGRTPIALQAPTSPG
jgi:AraC-like DNA-binding protein